MGARVVAACIYLTATNQGLDTMNAKHMIAGAVLTFCLFASWAHAEDSKGVTRLSEVQTAVDVEFASYLHPIVEAGKATYTVVDPDGVAWTVKVTKAKKSKKAEKHAATVVDGAAFYAD